MYFSDVYSHRAGKFVRRHRAAVTIAASFVLVLTAFSVGVAVQARRITIDRDRANVEARTSQRVVRFLTELFSES